MPSAFSQGFNSQFNAGQLVDLYTNLMRQKRMEELRQQQFELNATATLGQIMKLPKNIRGPMLDSYSASYQKITGNPLNPTLKEILTKTNDEQSAAIAQGLAYMGAKEPEKMRDMLQSLGAENPMEAFRLYGTLQQSQRAAEAQSAYDQAATSDFMPPQAPSIPEKPVGANMEDNAARTAFFNANGGRTEPGTAFDIGGAETAGEAAAGAAGGGYGALIAGAIQGAARSQSQRNQQPATPPPQMPPVPDVGGSAEAMRTGTPPPMPQLQMAPATSEPSLGALLNTPRMDENARIAAAGTAAPAPAQRPSEPTLKERLDALPIDQGRDLDERGLSPDVIYGPSFEEPSGPHPLSVVPPAQTQAEQLQAQRNWLQGLYGRLPINSAQANAVKMRLDAIDKQLADVTTRGAETQGMKAWQARSADLRQQFPNLSERAIQQRAAQDVLASGERLPQRLEGLFTEKPPAEMTRPHFEAYTNDAGHRIVASVDAAGNVKRFNLGPARELAFNLGQFRADLALRARNRKTGNPQVDDLSPQEAGATLNDLNRSDFLSTLLQGALGGGGGNTAAPAPASSGAGSGATPAPAPTTPAGKLSPEEEARRYLQRR